MPGWWIYSPSSACTALCSLSPQPRECGEADCEKLDVHAFNDDGTYSLYWLSHSPALREFTLVGIFPMDTWNLPEPCELRAGSSEVAPAPFTCADDGQSMTWSGASYLQPVPAFQAALETAVGEGQCEHTY